MRFIPTRIHGFTEYAVGVLLIIAPWLFGFAAGGAETWVPVILGLGAIAYSLFTDYELGAVRKIPMTTHLGLDAGSGVIPAASPWIFGFAGLVYLPHLIVGLVEIGAALATRTGSLREADSRNAGDSCRKTSVLTPEQRGLGVLNAGLKSLTAELGMPKGAAGTYQS